MTEQLAAAAPAATTTRTTPTFLAALTRTELFMVAGTGLILLTDLIFIPLSGYGVSPLMWAASAIAIAAILLKNHLPAGVAANYNTILLGLGALITLVAVRWLVGDLVWLGMNPKYFDAEYLIGMVGTYTGSALVAFSTWQLFKGR